MATLNFELVTADRVLATEEDVDAVTAPGTEGQLGVLPRHVPLITTLKAGELRIRKGGQETYFAVSGGFMEVTPDKVLVLADSAERSDEIDIARAEEARRRAQERVERNADGVDTARANAAMQRALIRLRVGERSGRRRSTPVN